MSSGVFQGSSDKAEAETCSSEEERATSPAGWSDQESAEHASPTEQSSGAITQMSHTSSWDNFVWLCKMNVDLVNNMMSL